VLKNSVVIDVGANIGNHSVYFSKFFSKVISIEPNPSNFELLKLNAQLADQKNLQCVNIGASDAEGYLNYSYAEVSNSGSVFLSPILNSDDKKPIVKVNSIDNMFIHEKISMIKIDVEGMELQVINGAQKIIEKQMPLIAFEQIGTNFEKHSRLVIGRLLEFGYKSFAVYESTPEFPNIGPDILKQLIYFMSQMFSSRSERLVVVEADEILPKDYSFIIALPDWAKNLKL
jgi:FkbM family methyltransferase